MAISESEFNRVYLTEFTAEQRARMEERCISGNFNSVYEMFSAAEKYEKSLVQNWWKIMIFVLFIVSGIMSI